jgi:hypothetical protein
VPVLRASFPLGEKTATRNVVVRGLYCRDFDLVDGTKGIEMLEPRPREGAFAQRCFYAFVFGMHSIWMLSAVALTVLFANRHDYASYLVHWKLVLDGKNPWVSVPTPFGQNTYGPLHNILAF